MSRTFPLRLFISMLVMCGVLGLSVVTAQDAVDQQPLLRMLAQVPDNAVSRGEIYFDDRKAIEVAYPPAKMPSDWAAFSQLSGDADLSPELMAVDVWWRVWRNHQFSKMSQNILRSDEMPDVVGFDFFAVEQEMSYGRPPLQTLMLNGSFDLIGVRTALSLNDFTQEDQFGVEVWCGPDGCDSGAKVNVRDRNPANPFGGDLGRKWPTIVQDGQLIGSPSLEVIQTHVAVQKGSAATLGDALTYRAAVDALTQNGVLMQAYFLDGELLAALMSQGFPELAVPPATRKAVVEALLENFEPLPVYKLLGFGDAASDSEQIGEIALVYGSEAEAQQAAAILPKRIANYVGLGAKRPLIELLADYGVTTPAVNVVNSSGQFVVVVKFATAKPTLEQLALMTIGIGGGNTSGATPPGMVYRLFMNAVMKRDIGWLSTIPRDVLEAAAQ